MVVRSFPNFSFFGNFNLSKFLLKRIIKEWLADGISSKLTDLSSQDGKTIRSNVKDAHGNRGGIVLL